MVPTSGGTDSDDVVLPAAKLVDADGFVVLIAVLPGSLVDRNLAPADRGRVRRAAENDAADALRQQAARTGLTERCRVIALFGDVVSDTQLLAANLRADAIVMAADDPHVDQMAASSEIPVTVVSPSG